MKLGELKPSAGATHSKKRKGRGPGSGLGKTAGRGHNGYHSRSGSKRRPWFEGGQMPIQRQLPRRGFSNHKFRNEFQIVNVCDLEKCGVKEIDSFILKKNGLIRSALKPVKVLANGDISKGFKVTATSFSETASKKIKDAGGEVIVQ
jgi:large subunit ribosomal protein L15